MSDLKDTALELAAAGLELANKRIRELEADLKTTKTSECFWRDGWHSLNQDNRQQRDLLKECEQTLIETRDSMAWASRKLKDFGVDRACEAVISRANDTLAKLRAQEEADETS